MQRKENEQDQEFALELSFFWLNWEEKTLFFKIS